VTQVARWTLKNDGIVFRDEDWARLKKIGAGSVRSPGAPAHAVNLRSGREPR
jgi:hypothetical protein